MTHLTASSGLMKLGYMFFAKIEKIGFKQCENAEAFVHFQILAIVQQPPWRQNN